LGELVGLGLEGKPQIKDGVRVEVEGKEGRERGSGMTFRKD